MVKIVEKPIVSGWIYPCSAADIQQQIELLPAEDLAGLHAIVLLPATRKDGPANGRYSLLPKPRIMLYSYPETLSYKQPAHTKWSEIEQGLAVELRYGMRVEPVGSRFVCVWEREDLRRFTLQHVLLREIGHHVYHRERERSGHERNFRTASSEQFAEDYALRRNKQMREVGQH